MKYTAVKFKNSPDVFRKALDAAIPENIMKKKSGTSELYSKAIILGSSLILCYAILVFAHAPPLVSVLLCVLTGLLIASIGFNIMHDGNHGSFSSRKWVNELMGFSLNILGGNAYLWKKKHNDNHHTNTNIVGHDDDIEFGVLARISSTEKWRPWHQYQHIYMWIIYLFTYLLWIYVFDFGKYFKRKICNKPITFTREQHFVFWTSKILHVCIFLVLPMRYHDVADVLVAYLIVTMSCGEIIAIVFQLAHVVEEASIVAVGDEKVVYEEIAIHQVRTTSDFATNNRFINWFVGGLNFQVEHHLFPKISHVHYPEMHKHIKQVCCDFQIKLNESPTLMKAIRSHFALYKKMGQKPNPQLV